MTRRRLPLWSIITIGGMIAAISLGVRSTFGLFLDPVTDAIGSDAGTFGLAIAIQNLMWGVSQPVAGAVSDRFGSGRVLAAGGVLYAIALWLMSTADGEGLLILSGGVLAGVAIGAASFAVVLSSVGRMVPAERRPMALGVVSAIGSVGQFVLVPTSRVLIDGVGWASALVVLGAVAGVIVVLASGVTGRSADAEDAPAPEQVRPLRDELRRAARARPYLLLNAAFFVCGFHVTFIGVHLTSYTADLGQSAAVGSWALAIIGLFNVFGSLAAGYLGSRYSNTRLLAGIYGLRGVVIAGFVVVPSHPAVTIGFGAAIGVLWLSTVPLTSAMVTEQFGTTHAGTLFGIVFLSHQFGAFAGAWMGGEVSDATGSYDAVWWVAVALGVFAMFVHLAITEGPVPDVPAGPRGGPSLAPAGGLAALVLVAGSVGAFASAGEASAGDTAADGGDRPVYCVLG